MERPNFYIVTSLHGDYMTFETEDQANKHALWLIEGFHDGTRSANDPKPCVHEVKFLRQFVAR